MQKMRLPTWALIWLTILAVVFVFLLANKPMVDHFMDIVGLTKVFYPDNPQTPKIVEQVKPSVKPGQLISKTTPIPLPESQQAPPDASLVLPTETEATPEPSEVPAASTEQESATAKPLYFVKIGPDGRMELQSFVREIQMGSTPLGSAIKALLLGPSLFEKNEGALSLIPEGSRLLSARVVDGTAYLSFNEEFAHNTFGQEGLNTQLKQVIWTATQFSSVQRVQFLIEGQYRDNLMEDGGSVALPLDRSYH